MNVECISLFYKDYYLSQFHLRHYDWVDKITYITKVSSTGIDNELQRQWYQEAYNNSKADWVIIVDIDELAFITKKDLENIPREVTVKDVELFDVWPSKDEKAKLDVNIPIKEQRCHGWLLEPFYRKPCIIRGGLKNIILGLGMHGLDGKDVKLGRREFIGAHLRNAELEYALETRLKYRKNRFSENNKKNNWSFRDFEVTEESIRKEFKDNENCKKIW